MIIESLVSHATIAWNTLITFFLSFFWKTSGELQKLSNRRRKDDKEGDLVRCNLNPNSGQNICLLNVEGGGREIKEVDNNC